MPDKVDAGKNLDGVDAGTDFRAIPQAVRI
jgi:hypothetical protein